MVLRYWRISLAVRDPKIPHVEMKYTTEISLHHAAFDQALDIAVSRANRDGFIAVGGPSTYEFVCEDRHS